MRCHRLGHNTGTRSEARWHAESHAVVLEESNEKYPEEITTRLVEASLPCFGFGKGDERGKAE